MTLLQVRKIASMKTWVLHEIATHGHSTSFILQSDTGWQGTAYHQIMLALSLKFPMKYPWKSSKIAAVDKPTIVWRPRPEEPLLISAYTLYFQKLDFLVYILPVIVWVYLHSNFCSGLQKTSFLQQSAYWPFKMIQGRWFWYQLKAHMWLPISLSL